MILDRYEQWIIARFFKKTIAIFVVGPVFLIFSPFVLIGEAAIRAFNWLFYAR